MKMFRILGLLNLIIGSVGGLINYIIMAYNGNIVFGVWMLIMCVCVCGATSMFCFGLQAIVDSLMNINNKLESSFMLNYTKSKNNKEIYAYICDSLEYIVNYLNNKSK